VFTRAEALAASIVAFLATAIVSSYLGDAIGFALHPLPIFAISCAASIAFGIQGTARGGPFDLLALTTIVIAVLTWLLWLAWPHLLPIGGGTDLTHHLLLIDYIDRTRRLVHDPALRPYLGEMADYTPGAHLLAVLAGSWMRSDGLHALYTVVAVAVGLKVGMVFLVASRCLTRPDAPQPLHHGGHGGHGGLDEDFSSVSPVSSVVERQSTQLPFALAAVLLLFLPRFFLLGSFTHDSFVAQVVSELFAVTMWWAIVCWDERPAAPALAMIGLAGAAAFLTWPVWLGPVIITLAVVVMLRGTRSISARAQDLAIALLPIACVAAVHAAGRPAAAGIAGTTGFALRPSTATVGWALPALGLAGAAIAAGDRRARTVPIVLGATALQAAVLFVVARVNHADTPYLALKMFYLAIYPLAIGGAYAIGSASRATGVSRGSLLGWAVVVILLIALGRSLVTTPRPSPPITDSLLAAGRWARGHVSPACVDYLVTADDSAYWLHLAVLGNARTTVRSLDSDTFEPHKALVRWILPGGLPYAIADDFDTLPRDIRTNVDVLARFGSAAVVKRRGRASCTP